MAVCFEELGKLGRWGNMRFQAAVSISLALQNNDTYLFPTGCGLEETTRITPEHFVSDLRPHYQHSYQETGYTYSPIPYRPSLNLVGYFQSPRYWRGFEDQIRFLLTPQLKFGFYPDYTSLHVRRGDYLTHRDCYILLDRRNYYDKAMEVSGGKTFLIFSDDIEWCKNEFKGNEFEFSEGNTEEVDFSMMMACSNNIIANSSFSWWSAFLNTNPGKKVIAPRLWFGPKLAHSTADLLPKDWITV